MIEGMGSWNNFDEIEENLTLDELLLLHDSLMKKETREWKLQVMLARGDVDMDDDDDMSSDGSELPPELLEREREWKERQRKGIEEGLGTKAELEDFKIGYSKQ